MTSTTSAESANLLHSIAGLLHRLVKLTWQLQKPCLYPHQTGISPGTSDIHPNLVVQIDVEEMVLVAARGGEILKVLHKPSGCHVFLFALYSLHSEVGSLRLVLQVPRLAARSWKFRRCHVHKNSVTATKPLQFRIFCTCTHKDDDNLSNIVRPRQLHNLRRARIAFQILAF